MKHFDFKTKITFLITIVSLLACLLFNSNTYLNLLAKNEIQTVQTELKNSNQLYEQLLAKLSTDTISLKNFEPYFNNDFSIQYYEGNQLKLWSNRKYLPTTVIQRLPQEGNFILPYDNNYYNIVKKRGSSPNKTLAFVQQLTDEKGIVLSTKNKTIELSMSVNQNNSGVEIISIKNDLGGSYYLQPFQVNNNNLLYLFWFVFVFSSLLFLYFFYLEQRLPYAQIIRFGVVLLSFFLLNVFINSDPFYVHKNFIVFQPQIWANNYIASSIGHLFIRILTIVYIVGLWYKYPMVLKNSTLSPTIKLIILAAFTALSSSVFIYYTKSAIVDSSVPVLDNNKYRWALIIVQLIAGFIYYAYIVRIVRFVNISLNSTQNKFIFLGLSTSFTFALLLLAFNFTRAIQFALWTNAFILLVFVILDKENKITSLRQIVVASLVFAMFGTFCLQTYSLLAEKSKLKQIAKKLTTKQDFNAIYDIKETNLNIVNDKVLKNQLALPFFSEKNLLNRLENVYFNDDVLLGYNRELSLEKYDYNAVKNTALVNPSLKTLERSFNEIVIENNLPIKVGDKLYIIQMVFYKPKFLQHNSLLTKEPSQLLEQTNTSFDRISYYVVENNQVVDVYGDVHSFQLDKFRNLAVGDFNYISRINGKRNYVYKYNNENYLFLTLDATKIAENYLNTLAYIFTIIIYFYLFSIGIYTQLNISKIEFYQKSVTNRIQFFILAFVYLATVFIGIFTYNSSKKQVSEFQNDRYISDIESITKELVIENKLVQQQQSDILNQLEANFSSFVEQVYMYSPNGDLIFTNNETLFEKRIWPRKMNPKALYQLQTSPNKNIIIKEKMFGQTYKGIYQSIKNKHLEVLGYLYLPKFDSSYQQKEQNSIYSNLFYNTFSLVLFLITFLSIFLMESFGQIFERIRRQLSTAGIGKELKTLEWKNEDEIGLLIQEYNDMVTKLDENAVALARTERESAWKDMAKQIAHEIKNPLTPMKLSIQHLKRRLELNDSADNEKIIKTLNNLEIQIGHLTNIANDFSSIAKMASPDLKQVNFKDIVQDVVDIFAHSDKYSIYFQDNIASNVAIIEADHTQINRVVTNLVKNAIQAIPESKHGIIQLELNKENEYYVLTVTDNGKGISIENRAKIFTPNFTTKKSGTGIGLMMSKKIIETHGGEISFISKEGEGTVFRIQLIVHQVSENKD